MTKCVVCAVNGCAHNTLGHSGCVHTMDLSSTMALSSTNIITLLFSVSQLVGTFISMTNDIRSTKYIQDTFQLYNENKDHKGYGGCGYEKVKEEGERVKVGRMNSAPVLCVHVCLMCTVVTSS